MKIDMRHAVYTKQLAVVALIVCQKIVYIIDNQEGSRTHTSMFSAEIIVLLLVQVISKIAECNPTLFDNALIQCFDVERDFLIISSREYP